MEEKGMATNVEANGEILYENNEEEEEDELTVAARAGIRLLEENAQLLEEVQHLEDRIGLLEEEKTALQVTVTEKEDRIQKLTYHWRNSIQENQNALSELHQAKEQLREYQELMQQQQQERLHHSPNKRKQGRNSSSRHVTQLNLQQQSEKSGLGSSTQEDQASPVNGSMSPSCSPTQKSPKSRRPSSLKQNSCAPNSIEDETKYEEEHRKNSVLRMELSSAQREIGELRPLQAQLLRADEEIQVLHEQVERYEEELKMTNNERSEERDLIQSLRSTIEIYQKLDDPLISTKQDEKHGMRGLGSIEDGKHLSNSPRRYRRKSDSCIIPQTHPASFSPQNASFHSRDEYERVVEHLETLSEQVLSLKYHDNATHAMQSPEESHTCNGITVATTERWTRTQYLEHQITILQDLLRRFRVQWKVSSETYRRTEQEKQELITHIEKFQRQQKRSCEMCERYNEGANADGQGWEVPTLTRNCWVNENNGQSTEAEEFYFSVLRRLISSWTTDSAKRMELQDWLTNAIRGTGICKPLYLYDLTSEIASGFLTLFVPILREVCGIQIQVEKRLRTVLATDLKLNAIETESTKTKDYQHRENLSLLWFVDAESSSLEEYGSVGVYSRRKAVKQYLDL